MMVIDKDSGVTTVMVLMTVKPEDQDALTELALAAEPFFAKQPGFVSASLHKSTDGTRLVQYLQWRSLADSEACMASPDWRADAGVAFMEFIGTGRATIEPQAYEVLSTRAPS